MEIKEIIRYGEIYCEMLHAQKNEIGDVEILLCDACTALKKLNKTIMDLLRIKQVADGGTVSVSNQGQAMDGYTELANYRRILQELML